MFVFIKSSVFSKKTSRPRLSTRKITAGAVWQSSVGADAQWRWRRSERTGYFLSPESFVLKKKIIIAVTWETNQSGWNWEQDAERAENDLPQPANPAALEVWERANKTAVGHQCGNGVITDRLARWKRLDLFFLRQQVKELKQVWTFPGPVDPPVAATHPAHLGDQPLIKAKISSTNYSAKSTNPSWRVGTYITSVVSRQQAGILPHTCRCPWCTIGNIRWKTNVFKRI